MTPAHPPLPTAWNLRFHPELGSHISTLMSESFDGVSVAATRQNSGTFRYALSAPPVAPPVAPRWPADGGAKPPAGTSSAVVIFASDSLSEIRLSQEAAHSGAVSGIKTTTRVVSENLTSFSFSK